MVNFIVCEDNKIILQKNIDIINKTMFKNNVDYKIYPFSSYTDNLKSLIESNIENKIYILDIELNDVSGINIASNIRNIDSESLIIISTTYIDYLPYTLKSKLMLFDFVSKFHDYENNLSNVILKALSSFNHDKYINSDNKKNIKSTKAKEKHFETNDSFNLLINDLDNNFIEKNKNYYVNKNNIVKSNFSHKNKKERSEKK